MMAVLEVMIYPNPLDNKIYVAGVVGGSVSSSGGGGGVVLFNSIGVVVMIDPNPPDHPLSVMGVKLDPVVEAAESASLLRTTTHSGENNRSV